MAPKVKKTVLKRPSEIVAKKPAGHIVTYVDKKAFKVAIGKPDCPEAIREEANRIMGLCYGQDKTNQLKELVSGWKVSGWAAPIFPGKSR